MTQVAPVDRSTLLRQKRQEYSAIARSRKRKIRELFAVATTDGVPTNISLANPDSPPINTAEVKFLDACDILQGRKLNAESIPARPKLRFGTSQQSKPTPPAPPTENVTPQHAVVTGPYAVKEAPSASGPPSTVSEAKGTNTPLPQDKMGVLSKTASLTSNPNASASKLQDPYQSSYDDAQSTLPSPDSQVTLGHVKPSLQDGELNQGAEAGAYTTAEIPSVPLEQPTAATDTAPLRTLSPAGRSEIPAGSNDAAHPREHLTQMDGVDLEVRDSNRTEEETSAPNSKSPTMDTTSTPSPTTHSNTTPSTATTLTHTNLHQDQLRLNDSDAKMGVGQSKDAVTNTPLEQPAVRKDPSMGGTSREVEAQLLRDSAAAAEAVAANTTEQATASSIKLTKDSQVDEESNTHLRQTTSKQVRAPIVITTAPTLQSARPTDVDEKDSLADPHSEDIIPSRQRSVSEVLSGEYSRKRPFPDSSEVEPESHAPITPTSQSPRPRARSLNEKFKSRERSKLSTVVFGKQNRQTPEIAKSVISSRPKPAGQILSDDYFTPLFVQGFSNSAKWMKPLDQILHHAHKTVSTPDSYMPILDNQACKVLRRVYSLQQQDKWSLRQPKRCSEPTRPESHWDVLLKEMKWMRTDFREERKWKMAAARNLAYACADWISLGEYPDQQRELQVSAVRPTLPSKPRWDDGELRWPECDSADTKNQPTPGLTPSLEASSPSEHLDDPSDSLLDCLPPSAIFTLEDDDVVFGLHHSPNTDRLLDELPMFGSPLKVPESDLTALGHDPDAHWRREALPLSKYVEGRMKLASSEPPRKCSRYQYAQEEDDEDEVSFAQQSSTSTQLEPQNPDVALFRPENKAIRDRLHAGHQFRPPNEHSMPFQTFYESRSCSQWTLGEDDELKAFVREYSYNWSLISSMLSTKSMFTSGAERRTPWECFERWVMLEGLPHDMQKTQYFKLWQTRIDSAQQTIRQQNATVMAQQAQQQQHAGSNGPMTPLMRRRLSLPVKVDRRRNQKHLTMIDAMRKLAKKRETTVQKQQHAANLAAMRKAQEQQQQPQPRTATKTPREYSIMRWEREQAMAERIAERMAQHQQRLEAQRAEQQRRVRLNSTGNVASNNSNANPRMQAAMQARAAQSQAAQHAAAQHNGQMPQNQTQMATSRSMSGGARTPGPTQMPVNGQARPHMQMPGTPNGNGVQSHHTTGALVPPMQMSTAGQMQMPSVNGQPRMVANSQAQVQAQANLIRQAQMLQEQQRQVVQMQQAQHQGNPMQQANGTMQNSPQAMRAAMANGVNQKNYLNNLAAAQAIAAYNATHNGGMSTPPTSGLNMPAGHSGSPRPSMPPQMHQTYVAQLQHIESQLRAQQPSTPQDMIREMAKQLLQRSHAQNAMTAAAGGQGSTAIANSPHQYAQLLRIQQQAQQAQAAAVAQVQAQQQGQHQRNSSAGSPTPPVLTPTPTPSIPKA